MKGCLALLLAKYRLSQLMSTRYRKTVFKSGHLGSSLLQHISSMMLGEFQSCSGASLFLFGFLSNINLNNAGPMCLRPPPLFSSSPSFNNKRTAFIFSRNIAQWFKNKQIQHIPASLSPKSERGLVSGTQAEVIYVTCRKYP